jgi:hypothetical protein
MKIKKGKLNYDQSGRAYPDKPNVKENWDCIWECNGKYYKLVGDDERKEWEEVKVDPKQETLEEVALRLIPYKSTAGLMDSFSGNMRVGFVKGAKWYQEQNKDKKYAIQDFLDMIHEFEEKELPDRNVPYHYEAEIAAGLKHFELFIKGKQLKDNK